MILLNNHNVFASNLPHNLKEIIWELNTKEELTYSSEVIETLENALSKIEYYEGMAEANEILDWLNNLDTDTLEEVGKALTEWRLHDTKIENKGKITADDLAEKIIEWYGCNLKELKAEADFEGLKISGTKEDLVRRLKEKYLEEHELIV